MGHDRYDVIIVGSGPAGSTAAKICAENNLTVALIEKGEFPGSKNMFGGSIFRAALEEIVPDFLEKGPHREKGRPGSTLLYGSRFYSRDGVYQLVNLPNLLTIPSQ